MKSIIIAMACILFSFNLSAEQVRLDQLKHFKINASLFEDFPGPFHVIKTSGDSFTLETDVRSDVRGGIKDNPLYKKIIKKVKDELLKQANKLSSDSIKYNETYTLGGSNFSGIKWGGLIGKAGIKAGRKLYPDYTTVSGAKRWIIEDRFEIEVDAQTFLSQLKESGNIEITKLKLTAFSGIRFRRTYTYIHYADSYLKGLKRNFKKLFLGFLKFGSNKFLTLEEHESITREDYLSASVGLNTGNASYYFLSGYAGGTIFYNKVNNVSIQRPGLRDHPRGDEILRISVNKSKITGASATVGLQAEFYKLLKLSLLSFEYSKNIDQSSYISMSFQGFDEELLKNKDSMLHRKVRDILKGKLPENDLDLMPYIISEQETKKDDESISSHLFLFDKFKGSSTSDITIRNANGTRYFFRHNNESSSYKKSILQAIFSSDKVSKYKKRVTNTVNLEYEVDREQRNFLLKDIKLPDAEYAYLRFSKEFHTKKTKGRFRKKIRKEAVTFGRVYTNIDDKVWQMLEDQELRGETTININAEIGAKGISKIAPLTILEWDKKAHWICARVRTDDGQVKLSKQQRKCLKKLRFTFSAYKKVWSQDIKIGAWVLKDFISEVSQFARGFDDLELIFGRGNVGVSGHLSTKTITGQDYVTYFVMGKDQGRGLIQDAL